MAATTEWGSFSAPTIDDEGTITVADGETLSITGALSGGGSIEVRPDATLALNGELSLAGTIKLDAGATLTVDSASPALSQTNIVYASPGGILEVDRSDFDSSGAFAAQVSGFNASDILDYDHGQVSSVTFNAGTHVLQLATDSGTVDLTNFTLSPGLTDPTFSAVYIPGADKTQIDYLGGSPQTPAPAGTQDGEAFLWKGPYAGQWDDAANWDTIVEGQTSTATVAPGWPRTT